MSSHLDYFSDLMEAGEQIRAKLAGPGISDNGESRWYQLATTDVRVLAIHLQKNELGNYQPTQRMTGAKSAVRIRRYGATATDSARLEISGLERPIVLVDIDRPDIFPLVEPFVVDWGGRLGGDGTQKPFSTAPPTTGVNEKKLVLLAAGFLGVSIFFCGCAGVFGGLLAYTKGMQ